jgi:two-component system, response regulator PdtaR
MVRLIRAERKTESYIQELQQAMEKIKVLSGIVPICMHCKQIRNDKGYWNQLEVFIEKHSEAQFSHGICEPCLDKYYPEED